jgi:hypothetical protein
MFVGVGLTKHGTMIDPTDRTYRIDHVKHVCADEFGGYSLGLVSGGYLHDDGTLAQEDAIRIEVTADAQSNVRVRECAQMFKELFEQESVLLNQQTILSDFV